MIGLAWMDKGIKRGQTLIGLSGCPAQNLTIAIVKYLYSCLCSLWGHTLLSFVLSQQLLQSLRRDGPLLILFLYQSQPILHFSQVNKSILDTHSKMGPRGQPASGPNWGRIWFPTRPQWTYIYHISRPPEGESHESGSEGDHWGPSWGPNLPSSWAWCWVEALGPFRVGVPRMDYWPD